MIEEFAWHKYPDERPEFYGYYLVTILYRLNGNSIKDVCLMSYDPYDKAWRNWNNNENCIVLAWMPCPHEFGED